MKKIVTILLFALTVFAGCSKDEKPTPAPTMPVNGVIYLHSESVLKNEPAAKAATRGATAAEQTLTYTFEAWTNDTKPRCVLHKTANGTLDEAAIEIALVPGTYDFLFWADYGKGTYTTDNLRQVSLTRTPYTPGSGRDAFAFALPRCTVERRQRRIGHVETPAGKVGDAEHGRIRHGRARGVGYIHERTDTIRRIDRNDIRSANSDTRVPGNDCRVKLGRRRFPLRAVCGAIHRPVDHGGQCDQRTRHAATAAELHDPRNGHIRITDNE